MYRSLLLGVASSVALVSSAFAADIYTPAGPAYAAVALPPSWGGFYLGINGGYGGNSGLAFREDVINPTSIYSRIDGTSLITGGFGGGQLGYNFQFGSFVLGAEADIQGANIQSTGEQTYIAAPVSPANFCGAGVGFTGNNPYPCRGQSDLDVNWFGTVRGKLGYAIGNTLLYVTGGFAYGGVTTSSTYNDTLTTAASGFGTGPFLHARSSNSATQTGWAAGAGIETKIAPNWSLKGEYQFIDLGTISTGPAPVFFPNNTLTNAVLRSDSRVEFHTVRVGLNYYFNAPPAPLPLK